MNRILKSFEIIKHAGEAWRLEWFTATFDDGREMRDRWLDLFKIVDGQLVKVPNRDETTNSVLDAFIQKKTNELYAEYGTPVTDDEIIDFTKTILERSWNGEWIAQKNSFFYIDNLADVLRTDFQGAARVVNRLKSMKFAGLNGFIIIPWAEAEESRQALEERTGHKELFLSDFGGWSCGYCLHHEDERGLAPSQVECVESEYIRVAREISERRKNS